MLANLICTANNYVINMLVNARRVFAPPNWKNPIPQKLFCAMNKANISCVSTHRDINNLSMRGTSVVILVKKKRICVCDQSDGLH